MVTLCIVLVVFGGLSIRLLHISHTAINVSPLVEDRVSLAKIT